MTKALYRSYRPQRFDQVLGQDRVVKVLKNQVESGMISHAYLFAGERGCGKTTCAKIFAKAINCKNPKDGSPCLECENCKAIEEETTMDVVEMDAASNRRIDDIRQLKETVIYPPNNLKYKVYIIDEAHMITREAFNALLKIMEEPPSHLVFILATTEIEKIPKTILSRVQIFEFNKIDDKDILKQIDIILDDLKVTMDSPAKDLIIAKAKGAMRDSLSILDQVLSLDKDHYSLSDVEAILGTVDFESLDILVENIINFEQKKSLELLFELREKNKANKEILESLTSYFRDMMLYKSTKDTKAIEDDFKIEAIIKNSEKLEFSRILDSLEILNDYNNKLKYSENSDLILEMCIIRLINFKDIKSLESRVRDLEKSSQSNIVDLVNRIIDEKLKNVDLSNIDSAKKNAAEISLDVEKKDQDPIKIEEKDQDIKEEKNPKVKNPSPSDSLTSTNKVQADKNPDEENKLDKNLEEKIKNEIANISGPIINTMFLTEGFNYGIDDNIFEIYYKDSMYYTFLEDKVEEIQKIVNDFTNNAFKVKIVASGKKKALNKEKKPQREKIENTKNKENESLKRLEKIFGNELIIK